MTEILIVMALWIPSMISMYNKGVEKGSQAALDWLEENGYIKFDDDGNITK